MAFFPLKLKIYLDLQLKYLRSKDLTDGENQSNFQFLKVPFLVPFVILRRVWVSQITIAFNNLLVLWLEGEREAAPAHRAHLNLCCWYSRHHSLPSFIVVTWRWRALYYYFIFCILLMIGGWGTPTFCSVVYLFEANLAGSYLYILFYD